LNQKLQEEQKKKTINKILNVKKIGGENLTKIFINRKQEENKR